MLGIGTYLLWILQGGFFDGRIIPDAVDHKLHFYSKRHVCLSSPQLSSDVEGQLLKKKGRKNVIDWMLKILVSLTLLHQTGALSCERTYDVSSLANRVPPDKSIHHLKKPSHKISSLSLNSIDDGGEVTKFDTNSESLFIDSCATGGLTGFKSDFIEGSYHEIEERSSDTTTGKTTIIGEGIATCKLKDGNGDLFIVLTKMACAPQTKFRLMSPQWLGIQDKERGMPKDKRCRCEMDEEEKILCLDERQRTGTIEHDPNMLVPVLNVNPGVKNFQSFNVAFNNIIQDEVFFDDDLILAHDANVDQEMEGVALNAIDPNTHLTKYEDAVELVSKNADLEDKLMKLQKEFKLIGTKDVLSKDQI